MRSDRARRWLRLAVGLLLLTGTVTLLATLPPPGAVMRHNTQHDVQATALFYMDLEQMPELEERLEALIEEQSGKAR